MKRKIWLIYIGFFAILFAAFYFAISGESSFTSSRLAVINPIVPDFHFIDQDGKIFTQQNTAGKVYVAEYFFTTCKGICPRMNANMRRIFEKFKDDKDFMIVSHTCMPETDSVPLLKSYERKMINGKLLRTSDGAYKVSDPAGPNDLIVNKRNWNFVTGDKAELYRLARQGYMIDNNKPDSTQIKNQFLHTQFFALVDKYGRVRGIYDGLKEDEIEKLIADIPELLKEKFDHSHFMNNFSNTPN